MDRGEAKSDDNLSIPSFLSKDKFISEPANDKQSVRKRRRNARVTVVLLIGNRVRTHPVFQPLQGMMGAWWSHTLPWAPPSCGRRPPHPQCRTPQSATPHLRRDAGAGCPTQRSSVAGTGRAGNAPWTYSSYLIDPDGTICTHPPPHTLI